MRTCAVPGCSNTDVYQKHLDLTFHRFPTEKNTRKAWLHACKRTEATIHTRICSDHFDASDYERDLKGELLNLKQKKVLKPSAVPWLKIPGRVVKLNKDRAARSKKRENKKLVEDLLASCETILEVGDLDIATNFRSKGTSNEAKTTTLSTPTSHDLPPSTSSAPASHDLPPSTLAHSTLHNWYTDEPESHQPCTDESSTYQHQSPPREDISEVNIQIKQEQEDSYLDELHTGENIANDGEESSIAFSEQMFPEMPGGVMQDTFEMFSRYMTSILRQLPVTKSYSLQQQFINEAINAKLEYEKQHPSKSPQRDCFSPLPPPPVYTTITEPTKDKPPAKRGRKRKGNNSTVSEGPSDSITQHLYPSNIKRELTNDIDFSGDIIEGQETTAALVLGGCHSEMDFEEDPEFKPDVKTPFEMVLCSEPLESVCSTPKTQKKLGKCPQSSEALDQLNRHIDERNPDTNHAKATKTGQKKKRLEEHNQTSTSVSSISLPVNKDKLEPNTRIPANLQVASHPQPASHLPLVQFPPVQNPQLFRLLMPNVTSTTVMNTDSQPIPSQPSNLNNT